MDILTIMQFSRQTVLILLTERNVFCAPVITFTSNRNPNRQFSELVFDMTTFDFPRWPKMALAQSFDPHLHATLGLFYLSDISLSKSMHMAKFKDGRVHFRYSVVND